MKYRQKLMLDEFVELLKNVGTFAVILWVLALTLGIMKGYLDLPVVYKSHSTGQIVRISGPGWSIENPTPLQTAKIERYETVWVK